MKTWIITILFVATLVCLALSASWWLPELMVMTVDDPVLIEGAVNLARLTLWILAALIGAIGAQVALSRSQSSARAAKAASSKETPVAKRTAQAVQEARRERAEAGNAPATEPALFTFFTEGGVRVIADSDTVDLSEGVPVLEPEPQAPEGVVPLPLVPTSPGTSGEPTRAPAKVGAPQPVLRAPIETPTPQPAPVITSPFNLPADLVDFTGRESEIGRLVQRLRPEGGDTDLDGAGRTVTISGIAGMGGIGKTALAVHVAHRLANEGLFPDAQLYIDLKGTEPRPLDPAVALDTLLGALQGPDPERPQDPELLAELWRTAMRDRHALLVLDNAADAAQVELLLPHSPGCAVLVTSRQRFSLPGADLLDLHRLKRDEARSLLQGLVPRLDTGAADRIASLCGGLPLALRIAGNYLALNEALSPEEYADRLVDERERLVYLRDPDDPDLDVAATLSVSVEQLDVGTHWSWTLLGLFPAPFDPAAAAALWGEGVRRDAWDPLSEQATLGRLAALRNRSLVSYDEETGRYHLHDLLRLAASRALEGVEQGEGARRRLVYHFLNVAETMVEEQRYLELDPAWPHLQMALKHARQDPALLSDLVLALNDYWSARGMARARAEWCQQAARACAAASLHQEEGTHLGNLGNAYADQGDARRAVAYYGQALAISRRLNDQLSEGILMGNLGRAYAALGEPRRAILYHRQAVDIAREIGDKRAEGANLGNLGNAYADLGEVQQGIDYYAQAYDIAQKISDKRMEGHAIASLGLAYAAQGDVRQAIDCQKQGLAIHREIGDLRGEGAALDNLGRAYADLGEPRRAIDYFEQAMEIARRTGDRRSEGADLGNLGLAYADLGEPRRATDYYQRALEIAREIGDRRNEGACLGNLGRAYVELGEVEEAMGSYEQALKIAQQIGDRRNEGAWLGNMGQALARLGKLDQATDYHEKALTIYREIGDRRSEGNHLASLGMLQRLQGDRDRAREVWTESLRIYESMKDPNAGRVWHWLSELEGQPQ